MALVSAAERKRKRRQKLKETGQYDKYNAKQAIDQQKYRKRQAEKEEKLPLDERINEKETGRMLQTSCKTWAFKNNRDGRKTRDREKTNQTV